MSWEARVAQSKEYIARLKATDKAARLEEGSAFDRLAQARIEEAGRLLDYLGVEGILKDAKRVWGEGRIRPTEDGVVLKTKFTRLIAPEHDYRYPQPFSIRVRDQEVSLGVRLDMGMGIGMGSKEGMMKPPKLTVFDYGRFSTDLDNIDQLENLEEELRGRAGRGDRLSYMINGHYLRPDRKEELDRLWSQDAPDRLNHVIVEMVEERKKKRILPGQMRQWHDAIRSRLPTIEEGRELGEEAIKAHFGITGQVPQPQRKIWLISSFWPRSKPAA